MATDLRHTIATDIPETPAYAPLEFDNDISRRDTWMFAPVIAAAVTLPLVAAVLFTLSVWNVVGDGPSLAASSQPTTFASRWPSREMPQIVVR